MDRIQVKILERQNIERKVKPGQCFKTEDLKHFYLVRDLDVLHANTDGLINTLYDNVLCVDKDMVYIEIDRCEFNNALNNVIFRLDFLGKEYEEDNFEIITYGNGVAHLEPLKIRK